MRRIRICRYISRSSPLRSIFGDLPTGTSEVAAVEEKDDDDSEDEDEQHEAIEEMTESWLCTDAIGERETLWIELKEEKSTDETCGWLKGAMKARVCLRSELGQLVMQEVEDRFGTPELERCSIVSLGCFNHSVEGPQPNLGASAVRIPNLRRVLGPQSLSGPSVVLLLLFVRTHFLNRHRLHGNLV
ncbi:ethylene-responsive transcription factor 5-like [Pyrus ussuriensis x Pyrus communis]|uniref:Ethylene-responsive transcription factor 5-like n=1 Tax=Pyrus ussuriensis x Pyrus communis TaxID=2448454 RepID=A0A5N5HRV1_9ROSA|nr:ethylene-responsive transcription factor 5-like [Pyrus ussuriensis x Pyrus communis]